MPKFVESMRRSGGSFFYPRKIMRLTLSVQNNLNYHLQIDSTVDKTKLAELKLGKKSLTLILFP